MSNHRRVPALDGLRAFAIVGVVIFHLLGISGVIVAGDESVRSWVIYTVLGNTLDIFFILSGFGLFLPVVRRGGRMSPTSDFLLKRFGRLQPEYWACLVVIVLIMAFVPINFGSPMPDLGSFMIHFFDLQKMVQLFDPDFAVGFWIGGGALWLIPVIAGLYLLFPLLARLFLRNILAGLVVAGLVTLAWKLGPHHFVDAFQAISGHSTSDENIQMIAADQTPAYLYSFGLGMAAAWVYNLAENRPENPWINRGVILAFAVGLPLYLLASIPYTTFALESADGIAAASRGRSLAFNGILSSTLRVTLILGLILGPLWLQRPFSNRPLKWLADQSFGIYLIHLPIAFLALHYLSLPQTGTIKSAIAWMMVVLPVATVYAWFSRRLIGEPARRMVERWIKRRRLRLEQV